MPRNIEDPATWIEKTIKLFINESPENTLQDEKNEKAWAEPVVGFSSGADPLYRFYKEDIGEFYLSPLEILADAYPGLKVTPVDITVISWILPQTEITKSEHRKEARFPTERWARARIFGEEVNNKLRRYVVTILEEEGHEAVAPVLSPLWGYKLSEKYLYASTWSERHAAHASGLGTFGLCDGLITPKGKAMRCGSVIARINIPPSEKPYKNHQAYCLFYSKGTCKKCIERCPVGALSESGHDKEKCNDHLNETRGYVRINYGFEGYGCGLCQTGVPCESKIPNSL